MRLRSAPLLVLAALLAACRAAPQRPLFSSLGGQPAVHVNAHGGWRALSHDHFEDHAVLGVELETHQREALFGYEIGWTTGSVDEEEGLVMRDSDFEELYLGLRRTWNEGGAVQPYVGLGGAWIKEDQELEVGGSEVESDATGGGGYARAGFSTVVGRSGIDGGTDFTLGVDVRGVVAQDVDFVQATVFFGVGR